MKPDRAWVLLPSGRRLNLLEPDPWAWIDRDLAIGLSRTYRIAGYSAWDLPLSVTQHSLTVLALRTASAGGGFTKAEARRELLHDETEAMLGGWDPITALKPYLGDGFHRLVAGMPAALDERYQLPALDDAVHRQHKHADHLAAAIRRSTPMRPTRRSDRGTACRADRRTSRVTRWWQRWTQSASTVRSSSLLPVCTTTTPRGHGDGRGRDSLPVFDAAHTIALAPPANPNLPRCLKATATAPRAARASTASRRLSIPCILQL